MARTRRAGAVLLAMVTGWSLSACTAQQPAPATPQTSVTSAPTAAAVPTPTDEGRLVPDGSVETVATDLAAPWSIAFTADGTPLVSERDTGRILEVVPDGSTREIGTVAGVAAAGEGGLLGLAVDDLDRLYAYSTGSSENRIDRFAVTGAPGSLALGDPETVLDGIPAARIHNGGRLAFGPDGMLYATTGDADQRPSAQNVDSLAGKILRMTPDGDPPADNPFEGSLVYSFGHRNPQGIGWAEDGTMFASEFGQDTWDELNIIVPGGNYGWPEAEGTGGAERGFIDPVQQWNPDEASPSGLAVTGGTVFVTGLGGARLFTIDASAPETSEQLLRDEYGRIRDVTVAPDGTLWVLTNNTDGRGSPREGDDRILSLPLTRTGD
ncbi:PQQ-dependent sugar dehydrogenase [Microbacterium sp. UBA3394]|uniref:PQQ-dependent sugar dehydrogenase n=1 Tax=Microbacterium sp. UBA3394 TaxID=1946945 RepID=UPI00257E20DD|nr:PQQ-dependent sugar dehydrogenase [Microbacterium sp. UBA3394]